MTSIRSIWTVALAAVLFLYSSIACAESKIIVEGLPFWCVPLARRSIEAVVNEIPKSTSPKERDQMLEIVSEQIFRGYNVSVESAGENLNFKFNSIGDSSGWSVELIVPLLREPADKWFKDDAFGIDQDVLTILANFPIEAITWSDVALREMIKGMVSQKIAGWDFSLLVRVDGDKKILQISFVPVQPFVLSIKTSVKSNALPVMFQTDLSAKLVTDMSPIIGIPVEWAKQHEDKISAFAESKLADRNTVSNIKASVNADFSAAQIAKLDTRMDSERFFFSLKLAAYLGSRGRVPELWLTAGWRTGNITNLPLDIYSETFLTLDEFKAYTRIGARFEILKNYMVGAELAYPDEKLWYRFWWDDSSVKPYFWWRWNSELGHNFAVGFRLRDDLALELHYDNQDRDSISLKGIFQF